MRTIIFQILAVLSVGFSLPAQRAVDRSNFLDLTTPQFRETISDGRGVPAFSSSTPVKSLPVVLRLKSVQLGVLDNVKGVYALVGIQNTSEQSFALPIGRDVQAITEQAHLQRKTFSFLVRGLCDKCNRKEIRTVGLTASSSSFGQSFALLKKGEEFDIRLFIQTDNYPVMGTLYLQLGLQEMELEDGRYTLKSTSPVYWVDLTIPHE